METVAIILGLALAGALAVIVWLALGRARVATTIERARAEAEQARRDADLAESRRAEDLGKLENIQQTLRSDLEQAEQQARQFEIELNRERDQREADQRLHAEREQNLAKARADLEAWLQRRETELADKFAKISGEALDTNTKRFIEQAKESFAQQMKLAEGDLDKRREAVDAMVRPIGETLERTHERLAKLSERIDLTAAASEALRDETGRLTRALSRPEVRGQYGEIQLRRVAELAGMTSYCDFTEQASSRDADGTLYKPDMVVNLPNDRKIIVDAKTNTYAYVEAVNAQTDEERRKHLDRFAKHVAEQAKKLGDKKYWDVIEGTSPDFVVMFIPGDHFIDAALQRQPDLIDAAATNNVILASPATLIGLLRAVAVGWREHALTEQARELFELGKELHDRAAVAFSHIENLGKSLEQATNRYNQAVGSIQTRLVPTLRRFEEAGAKSAKDLPAPTEVNVLPRGASLTPEKPD
jgi:DNA recombination protein RmuC